MSEENKRVVRRYYEEVMNGGRLDLVDELVTADHVMHDASDPDIRSGADNVRRWTELRRTAFADFEITIEDEIAERDMVVTRWTARGTHTGEFLGLPPTGKRIEVTGMAIDRIVGDKSAESWIQSDGLGLVQQLGLTDGEPVAVQAE